MVMCSAPNRVPDSTRSRVSRAAQVQEHHVQSDQAVIGMVKGFRHGSEHFEAQRAPQAAVGVDRSHSPSTV